MALNYRTKVLLGLLQELGEEFTFSRFQQLLFLYCTECVKCDEYYEFIPLEGKPYSLQALEDKRVLTMQRYLEPIEDWKLFPTDKRYALDLDFFEKIAMQELKNTWLPKSYEELVQHITAQHPYYANPPASVATDQPIFYTIGYEGTSPEAYINTLIGKGVRLLCDVRKNPHSKKYGFSKSELGSVLPRVGIEYLHVPELGIASEKRRSLETDSDYIALFKEYEQTVLAGQQGKLDLLEKLLEQKQRIAITCFEADPNHCHRSHVAKAPVNREHFQRRIEHLNPCQPSQKNPHNARKYS